MPMKKHSSAIGKMKSFWPKKIADPGWHRRQHRALRAPFLLRTLRLTPAHLPILLAKTATVRLRFARSTVFARRRPSIGRRLARDKNIFCFFSRDRASARKFLGIVRWISIWCLQAAASLKLNLRQYLHTVVRTLFLAPFVPYRFCPQSTNIDLSWK